MLTTWHQLSEKFALTSPTRGGRSVGIVRLRTQNTEFFSLLDYDYSLALFLTTFVSNH
jgi:hypothetical protein